MMPRTPDLRLSIDVDKYHRLPPGVRARFDAWMESESIGKTAIKLSLGEGYVVVERYKVDAGGEIVLADDGEEILLETVTIPVSTLPPRQALQEAQEGR